MIDIDGLISRGVELRSQIADLKAELDAVTTQIADAAIYPDGKKTTYVSGSGNMRAKVVRRVYEKWDQDKLNHARAVMGDAAFMPLFKFEWSPVKSSEVHKAFGEPNGSLLRDALTTRETDVITFEEVRA